MAFRDKNKLREYNRQYQKRYRLKNPAKVGAWGKASYGRNIEKRRAYDRIRYKMERGNRLIRNKKWREKNRKYLAEYKRRQRKIPENLLIHYLRNRLYRAGKKLWASRKTIELLGCSIKEFKLYIENQFVKGMTWENYGRWHIDHIIPLASGNDKEKLCHYTNLRPLWAKENLRRGKSILKSSITP